MLFNSLEFIYAFLPVTLLGFFVLAYKSHSLAASWLTIASLFFYGWWNPAYVGLLLASIVFNYGMGVALARESSRPTQQKRTWLLVLGISIDLCVLAYFKYANFFVANVGSVLGAELRLGEIVLPLGISFFTFTQIAFLVDAWRGIAREFNFVHYGLFVTYFPHLIAGPVLHHKEMMPQFGLATTYRLSWENLAVGLTIFAIGLFKKVVLADGVAPYVGPVFDAARDGAVPTFFEAWGAALAYTLQLYFDFSGYSDMAIGLSRMFGVHLPLNFNSPYQATSIIDFWRRWHMTLSRFLREYLYIPLGGNRNGPWRRHVNLMLTMLLGGLWHGAGWTFVVWGCLHGLYLIVNHVWSGLRTRLSLPSNQWWTRCLGWSLTFLAVVFAWVFFRADSIEASFRILTAMFGQHGIVVPTEWLYGMHWRLEWLLKLAGMSIGSEGKNVPDPWAWGGMLFLLVIAARMPNTQRILSDFNPGLGTDIDRGASNEGPRFQMNWMWAVISVVLLAASLTRGESVSEFLYFQF